MLQQLRPTKSQLTERKRTFKSTAVERVGRRLKRELFSWRIINLASPRGVLSASRRARLQLRAESAWKGCGGCRCALEQSSSCCLFGHSVRLSHRHRRRNQLLDSRDRSSKSNRFNRAQQQRQQEPKRTRIQKTTTLASSLQGSKLENESLCELEGDLGRLFGQVCSRSSAQP